MKRARLPSATFSRAAIYIRVSSEDQARRGYSLAEQRAQCQELAGSLGATTCTVFEDGGETGAKLDRPGLTALREVLQAGLYDVVVVLDPDRFARNLALQLALHEEFRALGVALEFVNLDWEDTPDGRLFMQLRGAIAEYEREKIRMRTYAGRRRKAKLGGLPCAPVHAFGYRYDPETKTLRPDPARAAVVREIFRWVAHGDARLFPGGPPGPRLVAARLTDLGIAPPRAESTVWHPNTVRQLVRNRRYIGELVTFATRVAQRRGRTVRVAAPPSDRIVVPVPALVDRATFDLANHRLAANGRRRQGRPKYPYLLGGRLICGVCRRPMHGNLETVRRRTAPAALPTYRCSGRCGSRQAGASPCRAPSWPAAALEAGVWLHICRLCRDPRPLAALLARRTGAPADGRRRRLAGLERLLADQTRQVRRLSIAFQHGGLSEADYGARLNALERGRVALETEAAALRASLTPRPDDPLAAARQLLERLPALPAAARRQVVRLLVPRAVVHPDGRVNLHLLWDVAAGAPHTPTPRQ